MLKISKQQALNRWDTLPQNLRDAIFDENNADIVWKFGRVNHLTDDKIKQIAGVAGDVLMGFMHPDIDEMAKEIEESTNIPKEIAIEAAKMLEKKILLKVKSELNEIYAPAREDKPKITKVDDIKKPEPANTEDEKTESKEVEPPANLPFAPLSTTEKHGIESNTSETKIKINKPADSIQKEKKTEPPADARTEPVEGSEAEPLIDNEIKPFLLHEEKPLFTDSQPPEKPSVSFRPKHDNKKSENQKPVSAKVSLPIKEPNIERVVHYSDFRTKLDSDAKNTK